MVVEGGYPCRSTCNAANSSRPLGRRCRGDHAVGLPQAARASSWTTIDAQVHAYERNHQGRPWAGTLVGPEEMTGDQMVAAMDAVGVDGAVRVSPFSLYRYDASMSSKCRQSTRIGSA